MSLFFDFLPYIAGALATVFGVWRYGQGKTKEERTRRDLEDAAAANETHERMNDAETSDGVDDDYIAQRLRERGKRNGGA